MRAPEFWARDGWLPTLLSPLSGLVAAATAARVARGGYRAPVPVICVGNAGVGGTGKTIVTLDLLARLRARGLDAHALTRGYGGRVPRAAVVRVRGQDAALVGDEARLLAEVAPCWVGADRAAGARAAVAAGAQVLVMDDGLQNPKLVKDASLLVVDAAVGFGNRRVLPAGPLRETVAAASARCAAAVLIGEGHVDLPAGLPVLRARLAPGPELAALAGRPVLAFAGIGRPEKFFAMLEAGGAEVMRLPFPDHHNYLDAEIDAIFARAAAIGAIAVTTRKDAVKIRREVATVGVGLAWEEPGEIERLLGDVSP